MSVYTDIQPRYSYTRNVGPEDYVANQQGPYSSDGSRSVAPSLLKDATASQAQVPSPPPLILSLLQYAELDKANLLAVVDVCIAQTMKGH